MPDPDPAGMSPQGRRWLVPAVIVAFVLAVAGWMLARPDDEGQSLVARDGGIVEQFPVRERASVDPIAGRTIDGGNFDSRMLAGKIIVYNIWGSWCAPCRKEAPDLKRLSDQTREDGVRFVGVDVKDNDASALAFQREFDISYPSIGTSDSDVALLALGDAVPLGAVPTTVVLDRDGRVAARIVGIASYYTLKGLIDDVVGEALTPGP